MKLNDEQVAEIEELLERIKVANSFDAAYLSRILHDKVKQYVMSESWVDYIEVETWKLDEEGTTQGTIKL
jgi:hypothetical protein